MFEEYLSDLGYTKEQIKIIHNFYPTSRYSSSTLLFNTKNLYKYLRSNNINNNEFISITITNPSILLESIENIKLKLYELSSLGFNKLEVINVFKTYPYIVDLGIDKIRNRLNKFIELGFSKEDVIYIITENAYLLRGDFTSYKRKFDFFLDYGYSKKNTIKIFTLVSELFDCNITVIKNRINEFKNIGLDDNDIIKITSLLPKLFIISSNLIKEKYDYLLSYGYLENDITLIIKKIPVILKKCYLEKINDKILCLSKLNFTNDEIVSMTRNNPYIFLYTEENILNKYNSLVDIIGKDNINKVCINFPLIFGYSIESIIDKINYYNSIKLNDIYIDNSNVLIFPLKLIKARYFFLSRKSLIKDNINDLFLGDYKFYKKYKIKTNKLLEGDF